MSLHCLELYRKQNATLLPEPFSEGSSEGYGPLYLLPGLTGHSSLPSRTQCLLSPRPCQHPGFPCSCCSFALGSFVGALHGCPLHINSSESTLSAASLERPCQSPDLNGVTWTWGCSSALECLPVTGKVLGSTLCINKYERFLLFTLTALFYSWFLQLFIILLAINYFICLLSVSHIRACRTGLLLSVSCKPWLAKNHLRG